MKITCNKGAKVTIITGSYSKDGGADVTGAEETTVSFPANEATTKVLNSTGNCITLKMTGAYLIEKITIENPTTGIETLKAAKAAKDGAIYNLAGQKVGKDFKGLVIKNGVKVVNK